MPARAKNIAGQRFGRLLVLHRADSRRGNVYWHCQCDCGKFADVAGLYMRNGTTRSCGCLRLEASIKRSTTHGHAKNNKRSPTLNSWENMLKRCLDTEHERYQDYGGRGIKVCDRWLKFENFLADMGEKPDPELQIERIDNDGNYELGNCRWATRSMQCRNRRSNHRILFNGKLETVTDVAAKIGIKSSTLFNRILTHGWSVERAIQTPARKSRPQAKARVRTMSWER